MSAGGAQHRSLLWAGRILISTGILAMAGCATPQKPLYAWGGYQSNIYQHLKQQASPEQLILNLERDLAMAASQGAAPPPGLYAHLGLLYLNTGKTEQAVQAWTREKELFPESVRFIDYLLNNMKKQGS